MSLSSSASRRGVWFFLPMAFAALLIPALHGQDDDSPAVAADPEITALGAAFVAAYNNADAEAIAALFAPNGEFVSIEGLLYLGRDAVQEEFAAVFESGKTELSVEVDAVRTITPNTVISDGTATITPEAGPAAISSYCVVYVKDESGNWKIGSLRDIKSEPLNSGENLVPLGWLIGSWVAETADGVVEFTFNWSPDGNFILGTYDVLVDGESQLSGSTRIGWNPQRSHVQDWTFDSLGGHQRGSWSALEDRWMVLSQGVTSDGKSGSSISYFIPDPDQSDRFIWLSTNRIVDGEALEDVELSMVRQPPAPGTGGSESPADDTADN